MGKRVNKPEDTNPFNRVLTAGKSVDEVVKGEEPNEQTNEVATDNTEEKKEVIEQSNPIPIKETPPQVIVKEEKKEDKQDKPDSSDMFVVKKKKKIMKRQKNLWLEEESINMLEAFVKKHDYEIKEGEVVDILIQNFLKLVKIK